MHGRREVRTLVPDAVLRCRKLEAVNNAELSELEKAKFRRMNTLDWQQQSFQKTLNERHKKWRMYDRAFRLKLKRELGADLAAALRLRTAQEEKEKLMFEQQLIEKSLTSHKKDEQQQQQSADTKPSNENRSVTKSTSAQPKSNQAKVSVNKGNQSAVDSRRANTLAGKTVQIAPIGVNQTKLIPASRPRTTRFNSEIRRDTDPSIGSRHDFGSVLLRILSNIGATPDLDDDFTIRKRALEGRERRLTHTKDDRYYNLVKQLVPQKIHYEKSHGDLDDTDSENEN